MGTLRLLLALWVVVVHGRGVAGVAVTQAWVAVQVFFIVSGFYMSLILHEKYTGPGSVRFFYGQRLLRLLPPYAAVLLLTLAVSGIGWVWSGTALPPLQAWQEYGPSLSLSSRVYLAAANLLVLGQAAAHFLGLDPATGALYWTPDFTLSQPLVWSFLAVPQAWSIELELLFYLLAPWLVRRPLPVLFAALAASLAVRLVCYTVFDLRFDPWTYRFFPNELALFLLGALAYRLYRSEWRARAAEGLWIWPLFALLLAFTAAFPFLPGRGQLKAWPFFVLATFTIPFLFSETKHWQWDRRLGELSYPLYLVHFLVLWIAEAALPPDWHPFLGLVTVTASLAAAVALHLTVVAPLEKWRGLRERAHRAGG
jgi:peptidoglycan/LPS O-acetylase OafA/YrhL